jgi:hypothetical protein
MKRKWWLVPIILVAVGVLWMLASDQAYLGPLQAAIGLKPTSAERLRSKPVCNSPVNPNVAAPTDCIPPHLAKLPPDPGPAGMLSIEGIDSDKDGVRDDVQRFIALKWGHSERAVRSLTVLAKGQQQVILIGDSVSREEARKLTTELVMKPVDCFYASVDQSIKRADAAVRVAAAVANTPQRYARKDKFEALAANMVFPASDAAITELCGYDPAVLPN